MDIRMVFVLLFFALIVVIIGIVVVWDAIDSILSRRTKEKRDVIKHRLTLALKRLCAQLNIPLSYHDDLGVSAGRILYYENGLGRLVLDNTRIEVLTKYEDEPWVLAHEIGHYMALKQRGDSTERAADNEALVLCKSILTQEEQKLMEISLRCFFEHDEYI